MKKKRILITGGAGFIGSHLCKKLLNDNFNVTVLDNLFTGNIRNLKDFEKNKNFHFIKSDVCKKINKNEFREIYNLACPASPYHYQLNPIETLKTNVLGTLNVLEYANKNKAKVLQASTSEIYGDPEIHPQKESYWGNVNPIGNRSCYDEGKRCAETLCFDYLRQYKIDIRVVRIFNTYGPNMDPKDGRVISNFIIQALSGQPITIYGDGTQTRSFCYINDLISAMTNLMYKKEQITGPINLGNSNEFKIIDLAELVLRLTKSKSKLIFKKLPLDDPKRRKPDITMARKVLNWEPSINLEEGVDRTISYFRSII